MTNLSFSRTNYTYRNRNLFWKCIHPKYNLEDLKTRIQTSNTVVTSFSTILVMVWYSMLLLLSIGSFLVFTGAADLPGTFWETAECKTCPYSLCSNAAVYGRDEHPNSTFTCWTHGTDIYNDT
jgi:hypothetical protein